MTGASSESRAAGKPVGGFDRFFGITEHGSTMRAELRAGFTTWPTMSYVLFVNPQVLSNAIDLPNGFTQPLMRLVGGLDRYPVLPVFVSCIQPPFVPFARARALGAALGSYLATCGRQRILLVGTGGLGHNPRMLFPPIDEVGPEWKPYHLYGTTQQEVTRQAWIDYEIEAHKVAAMFLADPNVPDDAFGLHPGWDRAFLDAYCGGDMSVFDSWQPVQVVEDGGIGAMEVLSWVAAGEAMAVLTGEAPQERLQTICRVIGVGFGITSAGPALIR